MTYGPKKKYCKSSLKHNQIFLYFMDILMLKLVICLPANLTRTRTRDLYPRHLDILYSKWKHEEGCVPSLVHVTNDLFLPYSFLVLLLGVRSEERRLRSQAKLSLKGQNLLSFIGKDNNLKLLIFQLRSGFSSAKFSALKGSSY